MDLLQLKYFMHIADNEHLNRTAEMLNVTPSTLSGALTRLEKELDTQLFDRIGRNIQLNRFGKIYYKYCQDIFHALENARSELAEAKAESSVSITIGLTNPLLWVNAFSQLRLEYPDLRFQLVSFDTGKEFSDIRELDLIIASPDSLHVTELQYRVLFRDEILLAVSPAHPFATRTSIDLSEAKNEGFVSLPKNTFFRKFCDDLCLQAGFLPKTQVECDYVLRAQMIQNENMVGLITRHGANTGLHKNTVFLHLSSPKCARTQAIFWHKKQFQTAAMETIKNFLVDYFKDYNPLEKEEMPPL